MTGPVCAGEILNLAGFDESYRQKYIFAMDFGTSDFKYGPISLGETPEVTRNRGYFPDKSSIMSKLSGATPDVVVGRETPLYLEAREDLGTRLIYPMRNGIIERDDSRAWTVIRELVRQALRSFAPSDPEFKGFLVVGSLSSIVPRYMYERLYDICSDVAKESGLIAAVTVIPQPLAVAIAHKVLTCVVIESGHGNGQIAPISKYPIRNALVAINRGGADGNHITAEVLKDCGYRDLAGEEALVRRVKESIGLVPSDLDKAIAAAKSDPDKFRAKYKVERTRIEVDLAENSWMRFLIGEYVFDPNSEVFQSYYVRGMPKPRDVRIGDVNFRGMLDLGEAIVESVERTPVELQPYLYRQTILSGGNFNWIVPGGMDDFAVDSATKIRLLLHKHGIEGSEVVTGDSPQYSVWRGAIVYGYSVPEDYEWTWEKMEGWVRMLG